MASLHVTADLARWITRTDDAPTPRAQRCAAQACLDWVGVTLAGAQEPVVTALIADACNDGGLDHCPVLGRALYVSPPHAARINGAASHALDFDDINKRMRGHPSVAILPALLAAFDGCNGADLLDAYITGTEVACALGEMMGEAHYATGFHATATIGTVAAAAGVCRLMQLSQSPTQTALSLAATQASGLRAMFGTMAKPLHAGLAAERGLMAARWAAHGLTAAPDGIESAAGFGPALSATFASKPIRPDHAAPFGIEDNIFKYHAACYYTHSAIEAVAHLTRDKGPDSIEQITIGLKPGLQDICDVTEPGTGLAVKFSVRHLAAMTVLGYDTTDPAIFTDALAKDATLRELRQKIDVRPLDTDNRMEADVTLTLLDDRQRHTRCDVSEPARNLDQQEARLREKFLHLAAPHLKGKAPEVAARLLTIADAPDVGALLADLTAES